MSSRADRVRLLPWTGSHGQSCLLLTDRADGIASRLADRIEDTQLGLAERLLGRTRDVLAQAGVHGGELGMLAGQLADALADALLIATSRGARLAEQQPAFPDTDSTVPPPTDAIHDAATHHPGDPRAYTLLTLPGHDLASARLAKRHVRDLARSWDLPPEAADSLESITAELVANALEHSDSHTVTVSCIRNAGLVVISVTDQGNSRTPVPRASPRPPCPEQEHGRGLRITAALSARWGARQSGDGLTVWAEIVTTSLGGAAR